LNGSAGVVEVPQLNHHFLEVVPLSQEFENERRRAALCLVALKAMQERHCVFRLQSQNEWKAFGAMVASSGAPETVQQFGFLNVVSVLCQTFLPGQLYIEEDPFQNSIQSQEFGPASEQLSLFPAFIGLLGLLLSVIFQKLVLHQEGNNLEPFVLQAVIFLG
jgi:hypothetical protein